MRRTLVGMVVAAAIALVPVLAMASNQEFAETIAASLRDSGKLQDYKIGVKFQDGTAWLRGRVTSQEQMNTALREALETPGVLRVVNNLEIGPSDQDARPAGEPAGPATLKQASGALGAESGSRGSAADLSAALSSFGQGSSQTAMRLQAAASEGTPAARQPSVVVNPLASSFVNEPVHPTTATSPRPSPAPMATMTAMAQPMGPPLPMGAAPAPQYVMPAAGGTAPAVYDQPNLPNYAWPSYAAYPNYAALTYPKQYSPTAWPYIGPFYPYPQVPLGWRKVVLEWHDGWWQLDFCDQPRNEWLSGLFRAPR
jgi:hypothetical protein